MASWVKTKCKLRHETTQDIPKGLLYLPRKLYYTISTTFASFLCTSLPTCVTVYNVAMKQIVHTAFWLRGAGSAIWAACCTQYTTHTCT